MVLIRLLLSIVIVLFAHMMHARKLMEKEMERISKSLNGNLRITVTKSTACQELKFQLIKIINFLIPLEEIPPPPRVKIGKKSLIYFVL